MCKTKGVQMQPCAAVGVAAVAAAVNLCLADRERAPRAEQRCRPRKTRMPKKRYTTGSKRAHHKAQPSPPYFQHWWREVVRLQVNGELVRGGRNCKVLNHRQGRCCWIGAVKGYFCRLLHFSGAFLRAEAKEEWGWVPKHNLRCQPILAQAQLFRQQYCRDCDSLLHSCTFQKGY